jgi:hypothetical protein
VGEFNYQQFRYDGLMGYSRLAAQSSISERRSISAIQYGGL